MILRDTWKILHMICAPSAQGFWGEDHFFYHDECAKCARILRDILIFKVRLVRQVRNDFERYMKNFTMIKRPIKIIYNSYVRQVRKNSGTHIIFLGKISAPSAQWFWYMYQIFLTRISAPSAQGFWGMDQIFFSPWLVRQVRKDFGRWIKFFSHHD